MAETVADSKVSGRPSQAPSREDFEQARKEYFAAFAMRRDHIGESLDAIIREALRIAAEQVGEREKVVAWLRNDIAPRYEKHRASFEAVADAIERGDHSTATPVSSGCTIPVPFETMRWLMGAGPDDKGNWFGDGNKVRGRYWWRNAFLERIPAMTFEARKALYKVTEDQPLPSPPGEGR